MSRFRKKPAVVEAAQWTGENIAEVTRLLSHTGGRFCFGGTVEIHTLEGVMTAQPGDWIIRGVKGELYPCKPDIFAATYEPAEERPAREDRREEGGA